MITKIKIFLTGLLIATAVLARSQPVSSVEITFNKTSSLVFPAVITSVDRGSPDVLARKAQGVENILQLKAARPGFPETNLTVITADGQVHQVTVDYAKEPARLVVSFNDPAHPGSQQPIAPIFKTELTQSQLDRLSDKIVHSKRSIRLIHEDKYGIHLSLRGIYIHGNVIFYHVRIANRSNIDYDVDFLRFFIQDKQRVKRTASQELTLDPIHVFGNDSAFRGRTTTDLVFALQKFTIPGARRLVIEMYEQNGGRNLDLSVRNKTIVRARKIG